MYNYDKTTVKSIFEKILAGNLSADAFAWFQESQSFNTKFAVLPRKTGKAQINYDQADAAQLAALIPGFSIGNWTADRLGRAYLLLNLDAGDKENYFRLIEKLFLAAEVSELVALYSALPVYAYPEMWTKRCSEGIRSNIANVLEAIMYHNPYPAKYLDEAAWNQLVLKAFFTDKVVSNIEGLDSRANKALAYIISDYVHERRAARREINPSLWRLVGPFIDDKLLEDVKWALESGVTVNKNAAALALAQSNYQPAVELLSGYSELKTAMEQKGLTWDSLTLHYQQ